MLLSNVSPILLSTLSLNTVLVFFGELLTYAIEEVLSCSTLALCLPRSVSLFLIGSFHASGNLCPATFFKVELNCKLEDVGSVVVFSLRDSPSGDLHNHLVCVLIFIFFRLSPSLWPDELPWLIL